MPVLVGRLSLSLALTVHERGPRRGIDVLTILDAAMAELRHHLA